MTDLALDMAPADVLRFAFTPPTHIAAHSELGPLYEEIVVRMRREAEGLPLDTNQQLLLAKIALGFVMGKYHDEIGWTGVNSKKDAEAQWLAQLREWNAVLIANKEKVAAKVIDDFKMLIVDVIGTIADDDSRRTATLALKEQFTRRGY